jgi:hypothetical protein
VACTGIAASAFCASVDCVTVSGKRTCEPTVNHGAGADRGFADGFVRAALTRIALAHRVRAACAQQIVVAAPQCVMYHLIGAALFGEVLCTACE